MRLFLSWSDKKSGEVASIFRIFIKRVIQSVEPWISSKDIDNGTVWFGEISAQLSSSSAGVIFITKNNQRNPWLLFESGALYKGLSENRIFTYLVDMTIGEIEPGSPFSQINHTIHDKESVLKLIKSINNALGDSSVDDDVISSVFDALWDKYRSDVDCAISGIDENQPENKNEENMLSNILENVLIINRRISRLSSKSSQGEQSVGKYIHANNARLVLKEIMALTNDKEKAIEIAMNFAPEDFIRRQYDKIVEKEIDDLFGPA